MKKKTPKTPADFERLARAEQKRKRKAAKRRTDSFKLVVNNKEKDDEKTITDGTDSGEFL